MGILSMLPVIGGIIDKGLEVVDKLIPDKDLAAKLKNEIKSQAMVNNHAENVKLIEAQMNIIVAEAKGNWLQKSWRPILMLSIVAIVVNNYILFPYMSLFTDQVVILDLPVKLWTLMTIGVGGYIAGRSGENIVKTLKN